MCIRTAAQLITAVICGLILINFKTCSTSVILPLAMSWNGTELYYRKVRINQYSPAATANTRCYRLKYRQLSVAV